MGWGGLVVVYLISAIAVVDVEVMGWLEEEKSGLLHIKQSLKASMDDDTTTTTTVLGSWVSDPKSDSCKWERVTCDNSSSSGHVIALSLHNLTWPLWPCLFPEYYITFNMSLFLPFHHLTTLNLSTNCFHQLLPIQDDESNSRFSMLESLDLSYNYQLNESIIQPLTALMSLKNLNLSHCNIKGSFSVPEGGSKSRFRMLETLDLSGNAYLNQSIIKPLTTLTPFINNLNLAWCNISGPFLIQELSVFRNLEVLDLSYNSLRSPSATIQDNNHSLSKLMMLRSLDLSGNRVDKSIFKYLIVLPTLKSLFLSHNYRGMNGILLNTDLCKIIELQDLGLSNNDLTGTLDGCLGNLTSLRALDLSRNSFSGSIPPSLFASLTSLEYLSLSENKFDGSFSLNLLANNSKLKVLSLGSMNDSKSFQVETENPPWIPSFQLEYLRVSHSEVNLPSRNIPNFLLYQHALKYVDLSNNNLVGMFPFWLLANNSRLTSVLLDGNSFNELQLPSHLNQPLNQLLFLNLSNNMFQGKLPINIGYFLPHLEYLDVSSNLIAGDIPPSIGEMSNLKALDLSYNNFSGKLPKEIFLGCVSLEYLRLSNNSLQGNIFSKPMNIGHLEVFLGDNNHFNGTLEDGLSFSASIVDISNNFLSGMLPCWIVKSTKMLSVTRNDFEGAIPIDLCKNGFLAILDLSHNRFTGTIPYCLFNSSSLRLINLGSNNLTGTIPESRGSLFGIIDLSNNQISGSIPKSFYRHSLLAILSLANNKLEGELSSQICQLQQINILDLSHNKFTGSIPSCFNNMSFGNYSPASEFYGVGISGIGYYSYPHFWLNEPEILQYLISFGKDEVQFVTKSSCLLYKGDILKHMSGLDLSSNQLTGKIPRQIGDLQALHALNLSHNHLNGTIPESFHNLKEIESLDLSYNNLKGHIPLQLQDLNYLSNFNVCFNNLSGWAPNQNQFANFDESSYKGNPYLSWSNSNRRNTTPSTPQSPIHSTEESEWAIDLTTFYWSFGASYVMVLLTVVTILWINPQWRRSWFHFINICLQKSLGRLFEDAFF